MSLTFYHDALIGFNPPVQSNMNASNVCISFIFLVIHLMCEYHQGLSMIGFKFKIYFISSFTVQCNDSLWNIELTLMNGVERERFYGVLFSCCPTLCFTKYLVYSIVIISGSLFLFRSTSIENSFSQATWYLP